MKITRISVWQLDLPLHKPYYLSGGRLRFDRLDSTIVRIDTDAGIHGWGEGCPWGVTYLPAFPKGIRAGLEELSPLLIGKDPRQLDAMNRTMDLALPGHPYVKAAIDLACWDILGKVSGLAVCELLGAREPGPVPIASSVSTGSPQGMLEEVRRFRDLGYRVHSCKVGADVHLDIRRIRHLAENERDGEIMFYDVNRAWLPREAITVMTAVGDITSWFEQPCETLEEIRQVRRQTTVPIAVDESLHDLRDLIRVQAEGIAEMANIKINRVGGLTKAKRMRDFCLATGITTMIMDCGGTVLSDTAVAHMAQSIPAPSCLGVWSCQEMISVDPAPGQGARNVDGCFTAPDLPGLGVEPDRTILGDPVAVYS
ncbi:mandelate racemase/muconate lactonizing enzyme family protein [Geminicoccaceae bacterium 1502E]|nr:mandelate racemase/muconate lactonizing enzyme family protein [Geminicoccaceae bacterium 1502E]